MPFVPGYCARYRDLLHLDAAWDRLGADHGADRFEVGRSVEGRPLTVYQLGDRRRPPILLSAMMHGIELIGGLALFDAVRDLLEEADDAHLVVMPNVNPDAVHLNLARLARGRRAGRRTNARGVDLNRNFDWVTDRRPWHPFAGSRFRGSPHYMGPRPFSEPESRAVRDVARAVRPALSLAFHSFGNLILYPWAHTDRPNPRGDTYRGLAARFADALTSEPYEPRQAKSFYPTVGDMDDWLDHEVGTLAFTVEVSRLTRRLLSLRRLLNPFCWMNPAAPGPVLANLVPGVKAMIRSAEQVVEPAPAPEPLRRRPSVLPRAAR